MSNQALYGARVVMADVNRALNAREPADANFLDATSAISVRQGDRELNATNFAEAFRRRGS